jgi:hypothetical protein
VTTVTSSAWTALYESVWLRAGRLPRQRWRAVKLDRGIFAMIAKGSFVAIAAMLSLTVAASAGDLGIIQTIRPMNAVSTDFDARHYVSFFTKTDGRCDLTVMSGDRFDETNSKAPGGVERLRLAVEPNNSARLDALNEGSLQFACAADASSMTLTTLSRVTVPGSWPRSRVTVRRGSHISRLAPRRSTNQNAAPRVGALDTTQTTRSSRLERRLAIAAWRAPILDLQLLAIARR